MQTLTPSAQNGAEGLQDVQEVAQDPAPLFDGPAAAKWVGAGSFFAIFLLVMILIIRGRVLRPAQRRAIKSPVFEPAGDDAEITFEEFNAPVEASIAPAAKEDGAPHGYAGSDSDTETDPIASSLNAERSAGKPKKSPFAGLFSRKSAREKTVDEGPQDFGALDDGAPIATTPSEIDGDDYSETIQRDDDIEAAEESRRLAEEEALRNLEVLEEQRLQEEAREQAEREAAFERRKNQAAIEHGLQSFADMDEKSADGDAPARHDNAEEIYHHLNAALEDRMASLFEGLDAKIENIRLAMARTEPISDHAVISEAHFAEFADLLGEQITALRETANTAIENLTHRIAQLETAPAGAAALSGQIADLNRILGGALNTAPENQLGLSEVLGRALPPGLYSLSHKLSNGKVAPALANMAGGAAPVVIDDQFPADAFAAYQRQCLGTGGGATARNNFQSIVRRHIADAVGNFIVRGETGDHAFALIPSEPLFVALHADFADLVQESSDAGLWMVSPTTLAATLQTAHAAATGAERKNSAGGELLEEIIALRERVTMLEHDLPHDDTGSADVDSPQATFWENGAKASDEREDDVMTAAPESSKSLAVDDNPHAAFTPPASNPFRTLSPEEEAFERLEREETLAETGEEHPVEKQGGRPPFPLR